MAKEGKAKTVRTSLSLPVEYLEIMEIIKDHEDVLKSSQAKIGLRMYFERHAALLEQKGIVLS